MAAVSRDKGAVHLTLEPLRQKFAFKAGQFAFLAMQEKGLREPHPFAIASAHASNGQIEFVIRGLGDYTSRLCECAKVGMHADIYAPYGRFKRPAHAKQEVWIGAGVGISPFISWLQDAQANDFDNATLVYCFNPSRAFPPVEALQAMAEQRGVRFIGNPGGLDALVDSLHHALGRTEPANVHVCSCGPKSMKAGALRISAATTRAGAFGNTAAPVANHPPKSAPELTE